MRALTCAAAFILIAWSAPQPDTGTGVNLATGARGEGSPHVPWFDPMPTAWAANGRAAAFAVGASPVAGASGSRGCSTPARAPACLRTASRKVGHIQSARSRQATKTCCSGLIYRGAWQLLYALQVTVLAPKLSIARCGGCSRSVRLLFTPSPVACCLLPTAVPTVPSSGGHYVPIAELPDGS